MTDKYTDIEIGRFPGKRDGEEIVVRLTKRNDEMLFSLDARVFFNNKPTRKGFKVQATDLEPFAELVMNTEIAAKIFEKEVTK